MDVMKFEISGFDINLCSDCDNIYDIDNFIMSWGSGLSEKGYNKVEDSIDNRKKEWSFAKIYFWCDISGWEYWVKERQMEDNYIVCTIELLKPLTKKRLKIIERYLLESENYFNKLIRDVDD